jgi:hypothetical protein
MASNGQISSWAALLQALEARFAPSQHDDPKGALFKLTQTGSVNDYLSQFETLANRIVGLPPCFLLSCFISGLAPDVRREVQALQPLTLIQAAALARLQEEKLNEARRSARGKGILPSPSLPPPKSSLTTKATAPPFKRLTPAEMALRREKGLCFNCEEKFHKGHKCASKFFLLIMDDDVSLESQLTIDPPTLDFPTDPGPDPNPDQAQISFHALSGILWCCFSLEPKLIKYLLFFPLISSLMVLSFLVIEFV